MDKAKYILSLTIAALVALSSFAQDGSSAYSFLNVPMSTRLYGLGGVNISLVDDDITTIDQNPALLGSEMSGQISMGYMRYVGESNFASLRYGHSVGQSGAWSAAIQYFDYGSIIEADETGAQLGKFSPKDFVFMTAYSHEIYGNWRGGINLKLASSTYADYSAMAIAADLGVNYFDPDNDFSFSLVAANLGGQVKKFNEKYDRLPIDLRVGVSKVFGSFPVRFSVTGWNLTKWHLPYYEYGDGAADNKVEKKDTFAGNLFRHLVFGADLIASPNWYLGLGYNYKTRTDMLTYTRSILSGFSLSGGIRVKSFGIGLAFAQPTTGATTFMFNLTCSLSELL